MQVPETEITIRDDGGQVLLIRKLTPGEYVLGRSPAVELCVPGELLSRQHARLTVNFDHLLIEDLGSSNGTSVNGKPITEATRLWPNQKVTLGSATMEFRRLKAEAAPDVSFAPAVAVVKRILPDELFREKKYDIGGVVAQGGMGAILDARQVAMKRGIAMKVMLASAEEADVLRFIEEAQITGQLAHPNIVPVYELGVDENDQLYYTMKFVHGITLRKVFELLATGTDATLKKYPLPALLTILQKVCDALAFAHSKGVIHRDLKPENVMLDDFGVVLVMDWGLAKILGQKGAPGPEATRSVVMSVRSTEGDSGSTLAGSIMGTPQYMSPEQARGEVELLDARSDIYALGTILFQLLYLRPPVTGVDAQDIVEKVQRGVVEWPGEKKPKRLPHLPGGRPPDSLLAVCRQALAPEASARYGSVAAIQADLLAYQNGFATGAEKAGTGKQIKLLVKRHKAASIGLAAVFLVGLTLGTKAVVEGRRAERGEAQARQALADLKKQAPALREMAESEAGFQRFDSALQKLDAAIGLDPDYLPSYWRRAWLLIGMDRLEDAAVTLRVAQQKDPSHSAWAEILPTVDILAPLPKSDSWPPDAAQHLYAFLTKAGAQGEVTALSGKLRLDAKAREKLINARLGQWLGKDKPHVEILSNGAISLSGFPRNLSNLEPLHGLPINALSLVGIPVTSLEPLRGMPLFGHLNLNGTKITDLSPLKGARLSGIAMEGSLISDLGPLAGMPLEWFSSHQNGLIDLAPLKGAPLKDVRIISNPVHDLSPLSASPIETLNAAMTQSLI